MSLKENKQLLSFNEKRRFLVEEEEKEEAAKATIFFFPSSRFLTEVSFPKKLSATFACVFYADVGQHAKKSVVNTCTYAGGGGLLTLLPCPLPLPPPSLLPPSDCQVFLKCLLL